MEWNYIILSSIIPGNKRMRSSQRLGSDSEMKNGKFPISEILPRKMLK